MKANAAKELRPAIEAVLQGKQFVSSGLVDRAASSRRFEIVLD